MPVCTVIDARKEKGELRPGRASRGKANVIESRIRVYRKQGRDPWPADVQRPRSFRIRSIQDAPVRPTLSRFPFIPFGERFVPS